MPRNKNILLISNAKVDPGGIGLNILKGFQDKGYDIDYLSLYPIEGHPEVLSIYPKYSKFTKYSNNIAYRLKKIIYRKIKPIVRKYGFIGLRDTDRPVNEKNILKKLKKTYDIVIVYFWHDFLTPYTINAIYEKFRCKIFFYMADFESLAGGCHYYCDCERYKIGCGLCPAWKSKEENDLSRKNALYRKQLFDQINPIISGNSYMQSIYRNSWLLRDRTYMDDFGLLDLNHFRKIESSNLRMKYNIPENKNKIIFFGCRSFKDPKKGMNLLISALNKYSMSSPQHEKDEVLLLIAGNNVHEIASTLPFDYINLGFLTYDQLPEIYTLATCYISPSINDAGPSMVAQSLACGTPVISFNIGLAIDCVRTGETGYLATLGDTEDLYRGIEYLLRMKRLTYEEMQKKCIEKSKELFSISRTIENFEHFF